MTHKSRPPGVAWRLPLAAVVAAACVAGVAGIWLPAPHEQATFRVVLTGPRLPNPAVEAAALRTAARSAGALRLRLDSTGPGMAAEVTFAGSAEHCRDKAQAFARAAAAAGRAAPISDEERRQMLYRLETLLAEREHQSLAAGAADAEWQALAEARDLLLMRGGALWTASVGEAVVTSRPPGGLQIFLPRALLLVVLAAACVRLLHRVPVRTVDTPRDASAVLAVPVEASVELPATRRDAA
ncbi:MAG: hypothetical protein AAF790_06125 [Planctomycetota bacterium]